MQTKNEELVKKELFVSKIHRKTNKKSTFYVVKRRTSKKWRISREEIVCSKKLKKDEKEIYLWGGVIKAQKPRTIVWNQCKCRCNKYIYTNKYGSIIMSIQMCQCNRYFIMNTWFLLEHFHYLRNLKDDFRG